MTKAMINPISLERFEQDLKKNDPGQLLRWWECELYVALNTKDGTLGLLEAELGCLCITSNERDTLELFLAKENFENGNDIIVSTMSLDELSRNAQLFGFNIVIVIDSDDNLVLGGDLMRLWGMTALVEDDEGNDGVYEASAYPFEPLENANTLPYGTVQQWFEIEFNSPHDRVERELKTLLVFDDQLDWNNPLFPKLPKDAKPLSSLSPSAQAFFERMRKPLLMDINGTAKKDTSPEAVYQNSLITEDNLTDFRKLRHIVDSDIVPAASKITLSIKSSAPSSNTSSDASERWTVRISFPMSMSENAVFLPEDVGASVCKANQALPSKIGDHPASSALRERIVTHLAWRLFKQGNSFIHTTFDTILTGVFPGVITNRDTPFQPDYTDKHFPCLARWQRDTDEVPVLLLGEDKDDYICMPLNSEPLPEVDTSGLCSRHSEPSNQVATNTSRSVAGDRLAVSRTCIDFPDDWYQGIRVSDQYLKAKFRHSMKVIAAANNIKDKEKNPPTITSSSTQGILMGCAMVAIIIMIVVLSL